LATAHNQATPTIHSSWMYGDPRNNYKKGADIEKSIFMHAEAQLVAKAAKEGTSLQGADLYVTTFPCPPCAMLIANSGIKRLYYASGYAVLDGKNVLQKQGVKIIKVESPEPLENPNALVPYPEA
jgi:dCMP deaminase